MATRAITAAEFDDWLTPRRALEILEAEYGKGDDSFVAKHTLLEHLRGGLLEAAAKDSTKSIAGDRPSRAGFSLLGPGEWDNLTYGSAFWTSGTLSYSAVEDRRSVQVRHFDVRFFPPAVRAIIPQTSAPSAPPSPSEAQADIVQHEPPVSAAHLQAWYDLYQRVYPPEVNTEPHALKSAQGMFHDKSVARAAIRKVRGAHKPGPRGPRRD